MKKLPTLLDDEVKVILEKSKPHIFPDIDIILSTPNENITIAFLNRYELKRNFNSNIADVISVEFLMPLGTFLSIVYPYKDSLELTIITNKNGKTINRKYKAIVLNKIPRIHDSQLSGADNIDLDTQEMVTIILQVIDPLTLALKNTYISTIYHNKNMYSIIKGALGKELDNVIVMGKKLKYNLNIYDLDNKREYENIHIQPFTKLIKLPYILQKGDFGLYNNDIGIYYTNMNMTDKSIVYDINVYPLTDFDRYNKELKLPKLLIINPSIPNIGKNELNALYDMGIYKLIVTDIEFKDEYESHRYNDATGLVTVGSDISNDLTTRYIDNDKIIIDNTPKYEYDIIDDNISDYAKLLETSQDDNTYKYRSKINKNLGIIAIMRIPNTDPEFVYPGMPIMYMFIKGGKAITTTGIVQSLGYTVNKNTKVTMLILVVLLKRIKES